MNEGSIVERKDKQKRMKELGGVFSDNKHGHFLAIMITKLEEYLDIFYDNDFYDIAISAKSPDPSLVIAAYTEISKRFDHPLHLGVTHAGPRETAMIRSCVPLGHLLASGIGDTVRISYASDPVYEVEDALEMLYVLESRERKGVDLIACPTCGRIQVDLFTLVQEVRDKLADEITLPIKVAVMGRRRDLRRQPARHHLRAGPESRQRPRGRDPRPPDARMRRVPGQGAAGRRQTRREGRTDRAARSHRRTGQRL